MRATSASASAALASGFVRASLSAVRAADSSFRDASGKIKGMTSVADRRSVKGKMVAATLLTGTAAAVWITNSALNARGIPVPTVPEEQDKDKIHHPEGAVIKNAPKYVVQGDDVTGHSEALEPHIPTSMKTSRDNS